MSPIRVLDSDIAGGVDSRSNPINMPKDRFLLLCNWVPKADGHLQLRDGYIAVTATPVNPYDGGVT
jgi:hypothetical protein